MIKMNKLTNDSCLLRAFLLLYCLLLSWDVNAQIWIGADKLKIPIPQEAKPYTRWWWLGSAVDSVGLDYNLKEFAKVGIGGVEITPIYGVQGNDAVRGVEPRQARAGLHGGRGGRNGSDGSGLHVRIP